MLFWLLTQYNIIEKFFGILHATSKFFLTIHAIQHFFFCIRNGMKFKTVYT